MKDFENTYHKSFFRFNNVPAPVPLINVAGREDQDGHKEQDII